jgi:hypothetical protein
VSFSPTITRASAAVPGATIVVRRMGFGRRTDLDFKTLTYRQRLRALEAESPPQSPQEKQLSEQLGIAARKSSALRFYSGDEAYTEELEEAAIEAARLTMAADEFAERIAKYQAARQDVVDLSAQLEDSIPPEVKKQRTVLNEEYLQVQARLQAEWIRAGLIAILQRGAEEDEASWSERVKKAKTLPDGGGDYDGMTDEQLLDYGPTHLAGEIYQLIESDGRLGGARVADFRKPTISGAAVDGEKTDTTAPDAAASPAAGTSTEIASATSRAT